MISILPSLSNLTRDPLERYPDYKHTLIITTIMSFLPEFWPPSGTPTGGTTLLSFSIEPFSREIQDSLNSLSAKPSNLLYSLPTENPFNSKGNSENDIIDFSFSSSRKKTNFASFYILRVKRERERERLRDNLRDNQHSTKYKEGLARLFRF